MRYMLLLYGEEGLDPAPDSAEMQKMMDAYAAFSQEVQERGVFRSGEPLQSVTTATTVRVRDGDSLVTDGPFAETKETLGGFYILDCKDLDEAIEFAAKVPAALTGSVEIRPIMEFDQPAS